MDFYSLCVKNLTQGFDYSFPVASFNVQTEAFQFEPSFKTTGMYSFVPKNVSPFLPVTEEEVNDLAKELNKLTIEEKKPKPLTAKKETKPLPKSYLERLQWAEQVRKNWTRFPVSNVQKEFVSTFNPKK
jgi:hypothetical protein